MQQLTPKEDSTHTFGKYVAQKLNQFDATKKAILIYKINQLIFDAEMEKLSAKTEVCNFESGLSSSSLSSSTSSTPTTFEFLNSTQFIVPKGTQSAYSHTTTGMESRVGKVCSYY